MAAGDLLVALAKIAFAIAIGLPLAVYLLQDRLMFYPQHIADARRADVARRFPAVREVSFAARDGTPLHVWHVAGAAGGPAVLYFGGNAEEVSGLLEAIGDPVAGETPGVSWWLIDYRGYGASGGRPSERALVDDATRLFDLVAAQARPVFALGRSLGSGVAVALSAQRPLAGVVLVTPFDSAVAVAQRYYPYLPVRWLLRHPFDSIALAPRARAPALFIIAGQDDVIPPVHAERLLAAWGGARERVLLPAADHVGADAAPAYWPAVRRFLSAGHDA